jgi:PKD repeat protein
MVTPRGRSYQRLTDQPNYPAEVTDVGGSFAGPTLTDVDEFSPFAGMDLSDGSFTGRGGAAAEQNQTKESFTNRNRGAAPVANFTANVTSGGSPLEVVFTSTTTGRPVRWFWTFGDGQYSRLENPTHTYAAAGSYTVKLVTSNAAGATIDQVVGYITVETYAVEDSYTTATAGNLNGRQPSSNPLPEVFETWTTTGDFTPVVASGYVVRNPSATPGQTSAAKLYLGVGDTPGSVAEAILTATSVSLEVEILNDLSPAANFDQDIAIRIKSNAITEQLLCLVFYHLSGGTTTALDWGWRDFFDHTDYFPTPGFVDGVVQTWRITATPGSATVRLYLNGTLVGTHTEENLYTSFTDIISSGTDMNLSIDFNTDLTADSQRLRAVRIIIT